MRGWSQHSYGNAIDVDQHIIGPDRGDSTALRAWVNAHPQQFREALNRWGISNGGRFGDFGHFEWNGGGMQPLQMASQ